MFAYPGRLDDDAGMEPQTKVPGCLHDAPVWGDGVHSVGCGVRCADASGSAGPPYAAPEAAERQARAYYDDFADHYEARRDGRSRYHDLLDELEVSMVLPWAKGRDVLEVGCGTGLILRHLAAVARRATGIDLSPKMLEQARARGLDVVEASARSLPFDGASFDLVVSFKTLPHVPELAVALAEIARVTKPDGRIVVELYNPRSLRAWLKHWMPAGRVGRGTERDVHCRYDDQRSLERALPAGWTIEAVRGIRIITPAAWCLELPWMGSALVRAERFLCDWPIAARWAGFVCFVLRRTPGQREDVARGAGAA